MTRTDASVDRSPETRAADLPFSDAVRVGELLFLSGQLGIRPGEKQLVPGGIEAETAQCVRCQRARLPGPDRARVHRALWTPRLTTR